MLLEASPSVSKLLKFSGKINLINLFLSQILNLLNNASFRQHTWLNSIEADKEANTDRTMIITIMYKQFEWIWCKKINRIIFFLDKDQTEYWKCKCLA